jgi:hypothetical protein
MTKRRKPKLHIDVQGAAKRIIDDYQRALAISLHDTADPEPKAFTGRHTALRAGLVHLEHLMKVAHDHGDEATADVASRYLSEWRATLPPQSNEEPESDGAGTAG